MYQFLYYLIFLFSATNEHGVHSPFVYDYLTKCLYKKSKIRESITLKILFKSIDYFEHKTLWVLPEKENTKEKIKSICPQIAFTEQDPNVIFGSINGPFLNLVNRIELKNDTMLLVDHIHKNKNNFAAWKQLKNKNQVRVTIDLFYCGIVFFRKEQVKQHFKIRI